MKTNAVCERPRTHRSQAPRTVKVSGWTYRRRIEYLADRVRLEVARDEDKCPNCPTCVERIRSIEAFLTGGQYLWRWEGDNGGKWLSLAVPCRVKPLPYLAEAIGLMIDGVGSDKQPSDATSLSEEHRRGYVRVDNWQNARLVIIEPWRVLLQITIAKCNHCKTCSERVQQMNRVLADHPDVLYKWEYVDGFPTHRFLSLARVGGEDALVTLKRLLKIELSGVNWQ